MKKEKLITRIIAVVLIIIIVVGLVVPYVSAYEYTVSQTSNESDNKNGDTPTPPDEPLPSGFNYVYVDGEWHVDKSVGNDKPAIMIGDRSEDFDATVVTIFICNLQTHKVYSFDLYKNYSYVRSMDLEDGYYVIFSNNLAWSTSNDDAYVINDNKYKYVYFGDDYDPDMYDADFEINDHILEITMSPADSSLKKIAYNTTLVYDSAYMVCPEDALLDVWSGGSNNTTPTGPTDPSDEPTEPTGPSDPEGPNSSDNNENPGGNENNSNDDNQLSVFSLLFSALKKSAIMIAIVALCAIGLGIVRLKKRADIKKQLEENHGDDQRIE